MVWRERERESVNNGKEKELRFAPFKGLHMSSKEVSINHVGQKGGGGSKHTKMDYDIKDISDKNDVAF